MVKAVSNGSVAGDFVALAVAADIDAPCSPCGICRQFIRGKQYRMINPFSFSPRTMGRSARVQARLRAGTLMSYRLHVMIPSKC